MTSMQTSHSSIFLPYRNPTNTTMPGRHATCDPFPSLSYVLMWWGRWSCLQSLMIACDSSWRLNPCSSKSSLQQVAQSLLSTATCLAFITWMRGLGTSLTFCTFWANEQPPRDCLNMEEIAAPKIPSFESIFSLKNCFIYSLIIS